MSVYASGHWHVTVQEYWLARGAVASFVFVNAAVQEIVGGAKTAQCSTKGKEEFSWRPAVMSTVSFLGLRGLDLSAPFVAHSALTGCSMW